MRTRAVTLVESTLIVGLILVLVGGVLSCPISITEFPEANGTDCAETLVRHGSFEVAPQDIFEIADISLLLVSCEHVSAVDFDDGICTLSVDCVSKSLGSSNSYALSIGWSINCDMPMSKVASKSSCGTANSSGEQEEFDTLVCSTTPCEEWLLVATTDTGLCGKVFLEVEASFPAEV